MQNRTAARQCTWAFFFGAYNFTRKAQSRWWSGPPGSFHRPSGLGMSQYSDMMHVIMMYSTSFQWIQSFSIMLEWSRWQLLLWPVSAWVNRMVLTGNGMRNLALWPWEQPWYLYSLQLTGAIGCVGTTDPRGADVTPRQPERPPKRSKKGKPSRPSGPADIGRIYFS